MRRKYGRNIFGGTASEDESLNPMDGVANLADVMLCLAVGIMLALVINWNIDVSPSNSAVPNTPPSIVSEIEGGGNGEDTEFDANSQLEKVDVEVYRDPVTGKLYMVEKNAIDS
jgi:hypothetical protein